MTGQMRLLDPPRRDRASSLETLVEEREKTGDRPWRVRATTPAQDHPALDARASNIARARRLLEKELEFMYDPSFEVLGAEAEILAPLPSAGRPRSTVNQAAPPGTPPYLSSLYAEAALLSHDQEVHLFRAMNYLKFRAGKLRDALDPARPKATELDAIERLLADAVAVKNQILRANLRLVVSIAKKRVGPLGNFFELVSDGNMSLIRAVEKFDYARGFRFSTYASWAIIRNFDRAFHDEESRRSQFVTGHHALFEFTPDQGGDDIGYDHDRRRNQETVQGMLETLSKRERQILVRRYGLGGGDESTLAQLGKELGLSKERVRQIEVKAREKLRAFALGRPALKRGAGRPLPTQSTRRNAAL